MVIRKLTNQYKAIGKILFPKIDYKMRLHYAQSYETKKIQEDMILYETRDGKSIVDSPYSMFLYLATAPEFSHFRHVWVVHKKDEGIEESIPAELREKVTFVYRQTLEYVDAMLEAKYLISNSTFESFFVKRPEQIYINTWHGTPLKLMGFDIPGKLSHSQNVLRNFLMADYILSPNPHTTEVFLTSYKLRGIYPGEILEGGYPRIDKTIKPNREKVFCRLREFNTKIESDKPTILFSPTWKGTDIHNAADDINQMINETMRLVLEFNEEYNVLLKVHPYVFSKIMNEPEIQDYLVSDLVDANEVLGITDVLVTDYSSIFFDYLVSKKPIVFYSWDKDLYSRERGLYISEEELPGPIAENIEELVSFLKDLENISKVYQNKYHQMAQKMVPYEDGEVTKRYIESIFSGIEQKKIKKYRVETAKKKLLIYPGGMADNGITSSFINLLNNIDYSKYDVTVFVNGSGNMEANNNLKKLNRNARPLFKFGMDILTVKEKLINKKIADNGLAINQRDKYPEKGYKREMNRLTANLKFDVAIDFSGYSYFWGRHILAAQADNHVIFMHNDLMEDSMKVINGEQPHAKTLPILFSIYYQFDRLLSVSPMTRDVNMAKLSKYVTEEQMSYVYNTINIDEILNHSKESDEKESLLTASRALLTVVKASDVEIYKNLDDVEHHIFQKSKIAEGSRVVQHASYEFEGETFVKVSINETYVGWVNKVYFVLREIVTYGVENFHAYGTVSRLLHSPVWKNIKTNTERDEAVTYIRPFNNRYVEIEKLAHTSEELYYFIKYNEKEVGWVKARAIQRVHEITKASPLNLYFQLKMAEIERNAPLAYSTKIEWTLKYGKLIQPSSVSFYSEPEGVTGSIELSVSEDYKNQVFEIKEITEFNHQRYCRLSLPDGSFIGHVPESSIVYQEELGAIESPTDIEDDGLPKVDTNNQPIPVFDQSYLNFVNMGRLSPEKNQKVLISAFKKFQEKHLKTRLYILGKGPLEEDLGAHIKDLGMEKSVFLLGHIPTPYHFMKQADCFVLPSLYEGQPMVLLEAMTLGMKILASNIPANINVVGEDERYGLLTAGTSIDAIYHGFVRMSQYDKKFEVFDYKEYNKQAIDSFYRAIN